MIPLRATNFITKATFYRVPECVTKFNIARIPDSLSSCSTILLFISQDFFIAYAKCSKDLDIIDINSLPAIQKILYPYTSIFDYFCSAQQKIPFHSTYQSLDIDYNCLGLIKEPIMFLPEDDSPLFCPQHLNQPVTTE